LGPDRADVIADAATVRARVENDHRRANRIRDPAKVLGDLASQAPLPIEGAEQLADVDDLRLDLDDKEGPRGSVPSQDVDEAALARRAERDFCARVPTRARAVLR